MEGFDTAPKLLQLRCCGFLLRTGRLRSANDRSEDYVSVTYLPRLVDRHKTNTGFMSLAVRRVRFAA